MIFVDQLPWRKELKGTGFNPGTATVTIAKDYYGPGLKEPIKRYADVSRDEFERVVADLPRADRHLYVVAKTATRHPYFDFDNYSEEKLLEAFQLIRDEFGEGQFYATRTSHQDLGRLSVHIRTECAAVERTRIESFTWRLKSMGHTGVDTGVYHSTQCFRMPYQSKIPYARPTIKAAPYEDGLEPPAWVLAMDEVGQAPDVVLLGESAPLDRAARGTDLRVAETVPKSKEKYPPFEPWPRKVPCPVAGAMHRSPGGIVFSRKVNHPGFCIVKCFHARCSNKIVTVQTPTVSSSEV